MWSTERSLPSLIMQIQPYDLTKWVVLTLTISNATGTEEPPGIGKSHSFTQCRAYK